MRKWREEGERILSSEFLSAIQRVFEDEEVLDEEVLDEEDSISENHDLAIADAPDGELDRSCGTLYVGGDTLAAKALANSGSETEDGNDSEQDKSLDDDDDDVSPKRGLDRNHSESGRSTRSKSRKGKSSKRSGAQRGNIKPKVNPHEIFEAELKKQQLGAKVLSISSLRQEMSDRRGASVKLLQKEFAERKKKRTQSATARNNNADDFDFAPRSAGDFDGFGDAFDTGIGEQSTPLNKTELPDVDDDTVEPQIETRVRSRWDTDESISELDDLMTVREDYQENHGFFGAAAGAVSAMHTNVTHTVQSINIPEVHMPHMPDMPHMPHMPHMPASMPHMPHMPNMPKVSPGKKSQKPKPSSMETPETGFQASFDDMPLTTIGEGFDRDDENELGLLSSGADDWADDGGGGGGKPPRNRDSGSSRGFSFGKLMKGAPKLSLKAPKLGIGKGLKNLMPKGRSSGNAASGGGVANMDLFDDNDDNGLLG
jgi:hypothetical protein